MSLSLLPHHDVCECGHPRWWHHTSKELIENFPELPPTNSPCRFFTAQLDGWILESPCPCPQFVAAVP